MAKSKELIPAERIERSILVIRGQKVMLDMDLAELYGVTTKRLNEQVKRNIDRFPGDFMFQLTDAEFESLRSQIATTNLTKRRTPPYAFTEHGAVMLASVLNSDIAVNASIQVVRAFVRLRRLLESHEALARKLDNLEKKYDSQFQTVFEAIRQLMIPPEKDQPKIGFRKDRK
ncbi:MAG TPA: ORF6N domain-containing protein [candidate division Zixibacteria bacterium]|nr:ORF6N domain-containing protein [candidate division Zixibacteria bacterium]